MIIYGQKCEKGKMYLYPLRQLCQVVLAPLFSLVALYIGLVSIKETPIVGIGSLVISFLCFYVFLSALKEMKRYYAVKKCIETNTYIYGEIMNTESRYDPREKDEVHHKKIYSAVCSYADHNGKEYTFKSEYYTDLAYPFGGGGKVKIYVDLELNPNLYYIHPAEVTSVGAPPSEDYESDEVYYEEEYDMYIDL